MLFRYTATNNGEARRRARIYTVEEHGIRKRDIDRDALRVTSRLRSAGFEAYVVGGAVRDLLIDKRPKDFDVVTDAAPRKARRLFRNSRVIGKRFRLVHVFFGPDRIVELSTFRASEESTVHNEYGTIEEDAQRRDFTLNALYYSPDDERIIDYVGGFRDVKSKVIRPLIPLDRIFVEDPVRMVRAIKYAGTTGFRLQNRLKRRIRKENELLAATSSSRMTEEILKIVQSGASRQIVDMCRRFGLLPHMLPNVTAAAESMTKQDYFRRLLESLGRLDREIGQTHEVTKGRCLAALLEDFLELSGVWEVHEADRFRTLFREAKHLLRPITPPNKDVEEAIRVLFEARGLTAPPQMHRRKPHTQNEAEPVQPRKRRRPRRRRRRKPAQDTAPETPTDPGRAD